MPDFPNSKIQQNSSNNIDFISSCPKQAGEVCMDLRENTIFQSEGLKCYKEINQDSFEKLLKKSQDLINFLDTFILKNDSHKRSDVILLGQYNIEKIDLYENF